MKMKKINKKLALLSALSLIAPFARGSDNNQPFSLSESKIENSEKDDSLFNENSIYSRHSVKLALLLAANGASPDAQKEILDCYGFKSIEQANEWVQSCMTDPRKLGYVRQVRGDKEIKNSNPVEINNSIWIKEVPGFKFKEDYKKLAESVFHATAGSFKDGNGDRKINDWVKDRTKDKIQDLIPQGSEFDSALVNTIYFKSDFVNPFKEEKTKEEDFLNQDGSKTKTKIMNDFRKYGNDYYENENFKSLRLDYFNGCHIYFFVPQDDKSLNDITNNDLKDIGTLMKNYDPTSEISEEIKKNTKINVKVDIKIPKFKDEYSQELTDYCKNNLGIKKIFSKFESPLTGICNVSQYVSKIIHKAFIELDEKGTTAAAATVLLNKACGCVYIPRPEMTIIKKFHANKNFKYIITSPDGTILFEGQRVKF